jgi:hypothetical protein
MSYDNGNRYDGGWKNHLRDGHGKFYSKGDSLTYDGQWSQDKKNGSGTKYFVNGSKYTGEIQNEQIHG